MSYMENKYGGNSGGDEIDAWGDENEDGEKENKVKKNVKSKVIKKAKGSGKK